jgi:enoyl-CoA hydratase
MDKPVFFVTKDAHVATVTLDRPEIGNKLLTEHVQHLGRSIREAGEDPAIKVVVVRANGEHFCMGRDPGPGAPSARTALQIKNGVTEPILGLYADIRATPVPVIAIVQGEARGFGCALVGQCDLAIASETAMFSMPELETHLPPTLAISAVLGKVPPKRLLHLIYTRRRIGAAEALQLGLLSEVVPLDKLDAAARETIGSLTDRRRAALVAVKEYMGATTNMDPAAAARLASSLLSTVLSSKDD